MGFSYTEEQQKVIEARGCDLLVSAAAGSGKTAVLVERIVRMVSDEKNPVDIDRLLIVTFTNAAAAEMRERISDALSARLEREPDNMHLQRQTTLLHNAQITTIDSFCLFIIRNNFNDIGLDPGFRVADEGELKLLRADAMEALMEAHFAEEDEAFARCLEGLHQGGDEKSLAEHIQRLYDFSRSYPFPEKWLRAAAESYAPESGEPEGRAPQPEAADEVSAPEKEETAGDGAPDGRCAEKQPDWLVFAAEDIGRLLSACADRMREALAVCEEADGPYMYAPLIASEAEMLTAAGGGTFAEYRQAVAGIAFGRLPSKKDDSVSVQKRELVKGIRAEVKAAVEKLKDRYFFVSADTAFDDLSGSRETIETLVGLTLEFGERLRAGKQEKNVVDFADIEHYALQILLTEQEDGSFVPSKAAEDYRNYFYEIMVDEYQDSNLVQEYLLQSISGEPEGRYNRFMVGDVKQSIYKFRLARPEIFMEKYDRYTADGNERKISLHRNFRSRREVTESVNAVFSRIMGKELGGVAYDDEAALYPGAVYPEYEGAETELLLLTRDGESHESAAEQEAVLIARRICRLVREGKVTDRESGQLRSVRYGDIAILLRTNAGWDEAVQTKLKEYGIPAYTTSSTGYFSSDEIRTMLHFLRILDNPLQDIPLFGALRSVIGGFDDKEIAQIRAAAPDGKLYEALTAAAGETQTESETQAGGEAQTEDKAQGASAASQGAIGETLRQKAADFLALVRTYREKSVYEPVKQLLREIMAQTGYLRTMAAFPGGDIRKANLEMLLRRAADFEQTGSHGLFAFIRYMEQLEKYDVDYGEAGTVDERADVVRIMSIHKSKGLEFPVCIVAGLAKRFNMQDQTKSLLMDVDFGLGCEYVDLERRMRRTTLRRNVIARKQQLDSLGEELRILYVAMTRAKEKLILTGCIPEPEKKLSALGMEPVEDATCVMGQPGSCWRRSGAPERVSFLTLQAAGSLLDFLLPAWNDVSVTDSAALSGDEVRTLADDGWRRRRLDAYEREKTVPQWRQAFAERFAYTYPWRALEHLYTKTTVSELKMEHMTDASEGASHLFDTQMQEAYVPRFAGREEKFSGSMRGSAFHRVMELLDFARLPARDADGARMQERGADGAAHSDRERKRRLTEAVEKELDAFLESGRLTKEEYECVHAGSIAGFLMTAEAERMSAADRLGLLRKEQPFMLGLAADRVKPEFPADETVLIQGIIDVYWEEDGELVVLDYKTDRVERGEELVLRYQTQLDYYGEALSKITGKTVKEKLIYSFHFHKIIYCKL